MNIHPNKVFFQFVNQPKLIFCCVRYEEFLTKYSLKAGFFAECIAHVRKPYGDRHFFCSLTPIDKPVNI